MAKVLVTGGAGFIGSHVCDRLLARGDRVIVLDDFSTGTAANLQHLEGRIELIRDSVLNVGAHAQALTGVTRIFHLAARISGYESLRDPEPYLEVNLTGLVRLIEVARALPGVRLIFSSSGTIYGTPADPTCTEETPVAPPTVYALTKYAGEHLLAQYHRLDGLDYVCLRLFNVYGPRQNPSHPYANVTCKFSCAAARGQTVRLFGDGEQSRDFVYIDDVVEAFLRVSDASRARLYNVGTGTTTSINSLVGELGRICGQPLSVERCPPWPNDIRSTRADVRRLTEEFGFRPRVSVAEGLSRTVAWFRTEAGAR